MGKRKSRRRRPQYDPNVALRQTTLEPSLEKTARDLYEKACCGSRCHWPELTSESVFVERQDLWIKFLADAHSGMREAQDYIVSKINMSKGLSFSEELLFRDIADSIAWQFLGGQLCHARRLFKEHRPPDLNQSNFSSVVAATKYLIEANKGSMPLISDLTSFVQVGDVLCFNPENGLSIHEVKEGSVNHKISKFLDFYGQSGCDRALDYFIENEGPVVFKQMKRVIRQAGRMNHVLEIMKTGVSTDPDTEQIITIPEEFIPVDYWDMELNSLIEKSSQDGWALDVIDNCLFVACYSDGPMLHAGHLLFNAWFEKFGADANSPRSRLMDSMQVPLALPVFFRAIPDEIKFDLLFGRKQICMGINVDALIHECESAGIRVRSGTNKETSRLDQSGAKPYRHRGKSLFFGSGGLEIVLMDGIFMRTMFHGQKPVSIIKALTNVHERTERSYLSRNPGSAFDSGHT